ncbi:MAG: hypothetical protein U0270_05205 [Labilithrix sp.]
MNDTNEHPTSVLPEGQMASSFTPPAESTSAASQLWYPAPILEAALALHDPPGRIVEGLVNRPDW